MKFSDKERMILEAAAEVFAEKGFFKATVTEIAKRAGVAKGTIYLYFENKRALFKSLVVSKLEMLSQNATVDLREKESFEDQIKAIIFRELKFFAEEENLAKSIIFGFSGMDKDIESALWEVRGTYRKIIEEIIQQGIDEEILGNVSPTQAVIALQGIINNFGFTYYLSPIKEQSSIDELTDMIYCLFIGGIRNIN